MIDATGNAIAASGASDDGKLRNMIAEHCLFLDQRRHDDYANLFADDGQLIMYGVLMAEGRTAIRDWIAAHEMPPGRHMTSNARIHVAGDKASGYSSVMFVTAELAILAIREYAVQFERVDGDWKIVEWCVTTG